MERKKGSPPRQSNSLHQSAELEEVFWGVGRSRISRLDSSRARITCQDEIADAISFFLCRMGLMEDMDIDADLTKLLWALN